MQSTCKQNKKKEKKEKKKKKEKKNWSLYGFCALFDFNGVRLIL